MDGQTLMIVAIVALCTMLTRFAPFIAFPAGRRRPAIISYLGRVLPQAVIGLLVVYCLRQPEAGVSVRGLPELLALVIVVLSYLWKRSTLISIALGTLGYMLLIRLMV